jgi:hypothetical protein
MNRKKALLHWAKNLQEDDLQIHFRRKNPLVRTPDTVVRDILARINSAEPIGKKAGKRIFSFPRPVITYAVSIAGAAALLCAALFLFFTMYRLPSAGNSETCSITSLQGRVMITADRETKAAAAGDRMIESWGVESETGSSAVLQIGLKSRVELGENSKIKILELFRLAGIEKTRLYLDHGTLRCSQVKDLNGSQFAVETGALELYVIGTEFLVSVNNNITDVKVIHGRVSIKPKLQVNRIQAVRELDNRLADRITEILEDSLFLSADEEASLSLADIETTERRMQAILSSVQESLEEKEGPDMNKVEDELENLTRVKKALLKKRDESVDQGLVSPDNEPNGAVGFKKPKRTEIEILSPLYSYYERDPVLRYSIMNPGDVNIYLNGQILDIENNTVLSDSVTGFNTLRIVSTDARGNETERQTRYFVNKLTLEELDAFDRKDSDSIGNLWTLYAGQINERIGKIRNKRLIFSGPTSLQRSYCVLFKYFPASIIPELVQIVNIDGFRSNKQTSVVLQLGISGSGSANPGNYTAPMYADHGAAIHAVLETSDGELFSLQLQEHRYWPVNRVWAMTPKKMVLLDFSTPKRLVFYKNHRNFYGIVLGEDGIILGEVESRDYSSKTEPSLLSFSRRKIAGYVPERIRGADILMSITNYYFYR